MRCGTRQFGGGMDVQTLELINNGASRQDTQDHSQSELGQAALFSPHPLLHNGHLQTALTLVKPTAKDAYYIDQPFLVDGGVDLCDRAVVATQERRVQLLAYFTPRRSAQRKQAVTTAAPKSQASAGDDRVAGTGVNPRRGLVLLLHGWLGCSHSNYNQATTAALTHAGYDVVRLNLRDHGPDFHLQTHNLNPGLFLGILIEEAHHAAQQIAHLAHDVPFSIVGVSMGGNFALRMALRHAAHPIPHLRKVIAVNPVLDPGSATDNVDRYPFYRRFFRKRWLNSLWAKERFYPELYHFAELQNYPTIRQMTEHLIQHYGERLGDFRTADEYFAQYAVAPSSLATLTVPTAVITAVDDPIIDVHGFDTMPTHPKLSVQLHPTGGHVGYVSLFPTVHYLPEVILRTLGTTA